MECFPRPWLQPMIKCMGPEDGREESRWTISGGLNDICVSWTLGKVFIATDEGIKVWSIDRHEEIFSIPCSAACVAISEDGKIIAFGSYRDNFVRLWDVDLSSPIGDPMEGHSESVRCIAMSGDGKIVVSGSLDNTVRQWDTARGVQIGAPLRGHEHRNYKCVNKH